MLSVEISSIYKKNDRTRKVHNVVILPDFDSVDDLNRRLGAIGNLKSDGRPILGLDSRDLLEICLEVCPDVLFIPAHIWTPHFAALGASSGFDSLEECYEDLLPHIHAVETGLSSDPPMNGRLSALDRYSIVSNSDAHSPRKLAREATCFDTDLSYPAILDALRSGDPSRFAGTIEFYPEERQVPLRRAPQMRRALEAKSNPGGRWPVPPMRSQSDGGRAASGGEAGRSRRRGGDQGPVRVPRTAGGGNRLGRRRRTEQQEGAGDLSQPHRAARPRAGYPAIRADRTDRRLRRAPRSRGGTANARRNNTHRAGLRR